MRRNDFTKWAAFGPLAVLLSAVSAVAAPLDADACARLLAERSALEAAGARAALALGPAAAKASLPPEKFAAVKTLIETDEQLYFRCPQTKPLVEFKEEPVDPDQVAETPAPAAPKQVAAKPKPKPKVAAKAPAPGETVAAEAPAAAAAKKAPAAKPKAKADDSYRAPAAPAADPK